MATLVNSRDNYYSPLINNFTAGTRGSFLAFLASLQVGISREHSGNIQTHLGNIQTHSGNIQGTFGHIQGPATYPGGYFNILSSEDVSLAS
jgi:hypothetical protein